MSDQPMTAEEIRQALRVDLNREWMQNGGPMDYTEYPWFPTMLRVLDHLSAREREHAELLARVERLEAKVMGDGR